MVSPRNKKILAVTSVIVVAVFLLSSYMLVWNFTDYYPDRSLAIGERIKIIADEIIFPIRIAKLSLEEPDQEIFMPVHGMRVSQISDSWGAPRSEGRKHEGQDIFAAKGTPVFSATGGYVTRVGNNSLGGNFVNIIGAGGRRYYYAHFDRVAEGLRRGQAVTTDTAIGFVGNTGNAESTPPHLHFGVYVLRKAIDPLPLLVNRPN